MMKVAIVGCGQLARMMAQAGQSLGVQFSFLAEGEESTQCVDGLGRIVRATDHSDGPALYEALGKPDVITVEREQVSVDLLRQLQPCCPIYPDPEIIANTQHRHLEKQSLQALDVPVAPFAYATSYEEVVAATKTLGFPVFIKSCEHGYDGKNQWKIDRQEDLGQVKTALETHAFVVEAGIPFIREISLIGVRSAVGQIDFYPLSENIHVNGTLVSSFAPSDHLSVHCQNQAKSHLKRLLESWDYVGVLAMECFQVDDQLLINELAPRVHNSGHWTMDGAHCGQFENHIRAILGMPLGLTVPTGYSAMVNLLGTTDIPEDTLKTDQTYPHFYNKSLRPGRKMGHVNLTNVDPVRLHARMNRVVGAIYGKNHPATAAHIDDDDFMPNDSDRASSDPLSANVQ